MKKIPQYDNYVATNSGDIINLLTRKKLKPSKRKDGYSKLTLYCNGNSKTMYVHRVVWMAHNGIIPQGMEINHIDCDKSNNSIENLELVSRSENMKHMYKNGLRLMNGFNNHRSKLSENDLSEAKKMRKEINLSYSKIANYFNVSEKCIRYAIQGKTYSI